MKLQIRRLNGDGINQFRAFLENLRNSPTEVVPLEMLEDPSLTEQMEYECEIEDRSFSTRYDLGVYLVEKLAKCDQIKISNDVGFWSWAALFYFNQLCPADPRGHRNLRENYTYVLSEDFNHRPRHAIRTTYVFVREYGESVRFMFSKRLHDRGEIVEQLAARQYYIACRGIMEAASALYADSERGTFKRGAASKGAGAVRRFVEFLNQITLTYDLYSLTRRDVLDILPKEFGQFKPEAS